MKWIHCKNWLKKYDAWIVIGMVTVMVLLICVYVK